LEERYGDVATGESNRKKKFQKRFDRMKTSSYLYETNEEDGVVKFPLFFPYRKEFKN